VIRPEQCQVVGLPLPHGDMPVLICESDLFHFSSPSECGVYGIFFGYAGIAYGDSGSTGDDKYVLAQFLHGWLL
jgi:hypothetical protein